jgi:hypothetical protein
MTGQNESLVPPWIRYPGHEPWWGGWRQGESEVWLLEEWLPFWRSLSEIERGQYIARWIPPDEDWHEYLTVHWK